MKYIKQFNDYVYFRIAKTYFKLDGVSSDRAIITLAFFYSLIIWDIVLYYVRFFYTRQQTSEYVTVSKVIGILILIGFYIFFRRYYKNRYLEIRERYINEPKHKRIINGILIWIILIIPLILMVLLGFKN